MKDKDPKKKTTKQEELEQARAEMEALDKEDREKRYAHECVRLEDLRFKRDNKRKGLKQALEDLRVAAQHEPLDPKGLKKVADRVTEADRALDSLVEDVKKAERNVTLLQEVRGIR